MKLTVLTDNCAGDEFQAEHGLSFLIEIDGEKILFDTGHTDVFLNNAKKLGINVKKEVQKVVLSHGHWDHAGGLQFLEDKVLIAHPSAFIKRFRKSNHSSVGIHFLKNDILKKFVFTESKVPFQITPNLFFLGEIPRINDFESQSTSFELETGKDDFVDDDSALAAIINNQLIVITGCSHSGICNICDYAQKVTGVQNLNTVIGGFHLKEKNRQTLETIKYFKKNNVKNVLPSHCTGLAALAAFFDSFEIQQVQTGKTFKF